MIYKGVHKMSMNTTRLVTFWSAGQAHDVIEFLDILRDELWETYGEKIIAMRLEAEQCDPMREDQYALPFEDDDNF